MTNFDFSIDWLADAPLTPDQRRAWNMLRGELASTLAKNQELHERVKQLEIAPPEVEATVLSRPEFNREVARMLAFDERYGGMSSVLYFDFENIEAMAAKYGRSVANAILRQIGAVLIKSVRGSDVVGRLAPDEFGVLLMRCDNASAWRKAEILGNELQKALAEIHGHPLDVKIGFGAYTFRDKEDLATGLKEAAQAMTQTMR